MGSAIICSYFSYSGFFTTFGRFDKYLAGIFFSGISYFSMKFFFSGVFGLGTMNFLGFYWTGSSTGVSIFLGYFFCSTSGVSLLSTSSSFYIFYSIFSTFFSSSNPQFTQANTISTRMPTSILRSSISLVTRYLSSMNF